MKDTKREIEMTGYGKLIDKKSDEMLLEAKNWVVENFPVEKEQASNLHGLLFSIYAKFSFVVLKDEPLDYHNEFFHSLNKALENSYKVMKKNYEEKKGIEN